MVEKPLLIVYQTEKKKLNFMEKFLVTINLY